jgi:hypothetical protein
VNDTNTTSNISGFATTWYDDDDAFYANFTNGTQTTSPTPSYWWGVSASALVATILLLAWILILLCGFHLWKLRPRRKRMPLSTSTAVDNATLESALPPPPHESATTAATTTTPAAPLAAAATTTTTARPGPLVPWIGTWIAALGILLYTLLLYSLGFTHLQYAATDVTSAIADASKVTQHGIVLLDTYTTRHVVTWNRTRQYLATTNELCPNLVPQLCTNATDSSTCRIMGSDNSTNSNDMNATAPATAASSSLDFTATDWILEPWYDVMETTSRFLAWNVSDLVQRTRRDLVALDRDLQSAYARVRSFRSVIPLCILWSTLLLLWTALLMGVAWSHRHALMVALPPPTEPNTSLSFRWHQVLVWLHRPRTMTRILLPVFGIWIAVAYITAMVGITGSIIVADTCVDNPDDRILLLLDKFYNSNMDPHLRVFFWYYIRGCQVSDLPYNFVEPVQQVARVLSTVETMLNVVTSTSGGGGGSDTVRDATNAVLNLVTGPVRAADAATDWVWGSVCGTDPAIFIAASQALQETACTLGDALVDIQAFFACENFRPIYKYVCVFQGE